MLGSTKNKKVNRTTVESNVANRINSGSFIQGEISSDTDFRVDGRIKGKLVCKEKVIIGETGEFHGEIECKEACIIGKMTGKIQTNGLLRLTETCRIEGEIHYKRILVEEGAVVIGSLTTKSAKSANINDSSSNKSTEKSNSGNRIEQTA